MGQQENSQPSLLVSSCHSWILLGWFADHCSNQRPQGDVWQQHWRIPCNMFFFSRHGTAWVHVKIESIEGASETMVYHHDLLSDTPLYQWHSIMVSWYHGCLWNNGFSTSHGFLLSTRHGVSSLVDISCPTGDLTPRHMRPSTQDGATTVLEKPGMPDARPKSEGSFF